MTTATRFARSDASSAGEQVWSPPTSGLEDDALLVGRNSTETDAWTQRIDDILAIRMVQDDWDGQGAKAPSTALVDSAIMLAKLYQQRGAGAPTRVVAGVNGTVIFEWQAGDAYCEIEVVRPFRAEAMKVVPGQPTQHWLIPGE